MKSQVSVLPCAGAPVPFTNSTCATAALPCHVTPRTVMSTAAPAPPGAGRGVAAAGGAATGAAVGGAGRVAAGVGGGVGAGAGLTAATCTATGAGNAACDGSAP